MAIALFHAPCKNQFNHSEGLDYDCIYGKAISNIAGQVESL